MEHIERVFVMEAGETPEKAKEWELKLNKHDIRVWVKRIHKGAHEEHPYIKTEIHFNSAFSMPKIIEAVSSHFSSIILNQVLFRFST